MRDPIGMRCPDHGWQEAVTRCRWCKFDPLKSSSSGSNASSPAILPLGEPAFSLPRAQFEQMLDWMP